MDKDLLEKKKLIHKKVDERLALFRALSLPEQSAVMEGLSAHVQQSLLRDLRVDEITEVIDHMDPRQAENILSRIKDEKRRLKIIRKIKTEASEPIVYFLRLLPKARLMHLMNIIKIPGLFLRY
jgi:Mg/Co/Ni transporter MgtE